MKYLTLAMLAGFMLAACAQEDIEITETAPQADTQPQAEIHNATPEIDLATVVIHPTAGNSAEGVVTFTETNGGIRVQGTVSGLSPDSLHGFHIHEYGDCRADDGTSAGGHYNPQGMQHGAPTDDERHVGDLGNLHADEDGTATVDYVDPVLSFTGPNGILGYGVIVHAGEDDLVSQPTGDAGGRIGCGVIGVANSGF